MHISELVRYGISVLTAAGVPDCTSDIYLLLGRCLGKSRTQLLIAAGEDVPGAAELLFKELLDRRRQREPLAYILGEQEFWSRSFVVTPSVLIPRPETEFLLETALKCIRNDPSFPEGAVLDLCCGSGVIASILALELRRKVIAVDLSAEALAVTRINCLRHGVDDAVCLLQSDLLSALKPHGKVSLVVSNPPYVSTYAVQNEVEPEVGEYEPLLALDGGEKGLDLIARIREELPLVLAPGGGLFMEIGYDQGQAVAEMFSAPRQGLRDFTHIMILKDYADRDRVLHARIC
jgi:release factor glutamine methyltransferase